MSEAGMNARLLARRQRYIEGILGWHAADPGPPTEPSWEDVPDWDLPRRLHAAEAACTMRRTPAFFRGNDTGAYPQFGYAPKIGMRTTGPDSWSVSPAGVVSYRTSDLLTSRQNRVPIPTITRPLPRLPQGWEPVAVKRTARFAGGLLLVVANTRGRAPAGLEHWQQVVAVPTRPVILPVRPTNKRKPTVPSKTKV